MEDECVMRVAPDGVVLACPKRLVITCFICGVPSSYITTSDKKKDLAIVEKDVMHPPGVEPGPIAWKAIILPLDQECLMKRLAFMRFM